MKQVTDLVERIFKIVLTVCGAILGLIIVYSVGAFLHSVSAASQYLGGGGGWYTFLYVIYWIVCILLILCGVYALLKKFGIMDSILNNANSNNAQQNFADPTATPANAQQQTNVKYCTKCGAAVPSANQFCNNCGNKME